MKSVSMEKLRRIIELEVTSNITQLLYKDAFAAGCFLHQMGEKMAGRKLCYGVLDSLGFESRKGYFTEILETIDGNEDAYALAIRPHHEIINIFTQKSYSEHCLST